MGGQCGQCEAGGSVCKPVQETAMTRKRQVCFAKTERRILQNGLWFEDGVSGKGKTDWSKAKAKGEAKAAAAGK